MFKSSTNQLSPKASNILNALQCQGQSNDCGAYTTASVLNAMCGANLKGDDLATEMERPVRRGILPLVRKIPNSATLPWGMVDVFRSYGYRSNWRIFTKTEYLRKHLTGNKVLMPIIGTWKPISAHVMTLVAWDAKKGWGFANTQYNHHDIHWLPAETFNRQWRAMGHLLVEVTVG